MLFKISWIYNITWLTNINNTLLTQNKEKLDRKHEDLLLWCKYTLFMQIIFSGEKSFRQDQIWWCKYHTPGLFNSYQINNANKLVKKIESKTLLFV